MSTTILNRRELVVAGSALVAAISLPLGLGAETTQIGSNEPRATLDDCHIDDMWGVYPRPHEAIGYGCPRCDGDAVAWVVPADAQFVSASSASGSAE